LTDAVGNVGTAATAAATLAKTAPGGYTITADPSILGSFTQLAAGFDFTGATVGDTYHYSFSSSGGGTPVTGSGNVTSATQNVGGIGVSTLANGTLTISVTLTNPAGNTGLPATATVLLDTLAPSGYTLSADQTNIDTSNQASVGCTISDAELGATYSLGVASDGGSGTVTASGTITSATQDITGLNVTSLPEGNITFRINLIDAAGNAGSLVSATSVLNRGVPSGYTVTLDHNGLFNITTSTAAGFTINNGATGDTWKATFSGEDLVAQTVNNKTVYVPEPYYFSATGTITSAATHVGSIDLSSFLSAPQPTFTLTLSNAQGTGAVQTASLQINRQAPAGYTIAVDQSIFNATAAADAGFTFTNAEVGDTYNYIIGSALTNVRGSGTVTSATQHVTGINIDSVPSGAIFFNVTLTNAVGNTGPLAVDTATGTQPTAILNTVPPTGYSIVAAAANLSAATAVNTAFSLTGATLGTTYQYTVTSSGGGTPVTGGGDVASATQDITGIDVSSLPDGTLTYSVTLTSSLGNVGAPATATVGLYQKVPSGFTVAADQSLINDVTASSTGFTLSGARVGDTFVYTISPSSGSPITASGSVTSATQDFTGLNLSTLASGTVTFSVTLTDPLGQTGASQSATAMLDPALPTAIALSSSAAPTTSGGRVGVLQTVGPESTASYTYTLVPGDGSTDNASFQISGDELLTNAALSAGGQAYSIRVRSTDAQGQSIEQQFLITVSADPVAPTVSISNTSIVGSTSGSGSAVGTLNTTGAVVGSQVAYTLVSGTGSTGNGSFKIVDNQLEAAGPLAKGVYTVRVRSSSTFLISDVLDLTGITGPYAFQISYDPAQLPSSSFRLVAAEAGLLTLSSDPTGSWYPAITTNTEVHGSLAEPNYQGPYSSFWSSVTATHPSATLAEVVGSSGINQADNTMWAVVDRPGEYAAAAQVFNEQVFTITVT
jgi:hypothetical protein